MDVNERLRRRAILAGLEEENGAALTRARFDYLAAIVPLPQGDAESEFKRYNDLFAQRRNAYFDVLENLAPHVEWPRPAPEPMSVRDASADENSSAVPLSPEKQALVAFYRHAAGGPTVPVPPPDPNPPATPAG